MPLTKKGRDIKANMEREYGKKEGDSIFYASENSGRIRGVHRGGKRKARRRRRSSRR